MENFKKFVKKEKTISNHMKANPSLPMQFSLREGKKDDEPEKTRILGEQKGKEN